VETVWRTAGEKAAGNFHAYCGDLVNKVLTRSMNALSTDNVTALVIAFKGLQQAYKGKPPS
jgi:hypothetical protein